MRSAEIEEKLMRAERRNVELGKSHAVRLLLPHHNVNIIFGGNRIILCRYDFMQAASLYELSIRHCGMRCPFTRVGQLKDISYSQATKANSNAM